MLVTICLLRGDSINQCEMDMNASFIQHTGTREGEYIFNNSCAGPGIHESLFKLSAEIPWRCDYLPPLARATANPGIRGVTWMAECRKAWLMRVSTSDVKLTASEQVFAASWDRGGSTGHGALWQKQVMSVTRCRCRASAIYCSHHDSECDRKIQYGDLRKSITYECERVTRCCM